MSSMAAMPAALDELVMQHGQEVQYNQHIEL